MNQFIPTFFHSVLESRGHSSQHLLTPGIQELQNVYHRMLNGVRIIIMLKGERNRIMLVNYLNIADIDMLVKITSTVPLSPLK